MLMRSVTSTFPILRMTAALFGHSIRQELSGDEITQGEFREGVAETWEHPPLLRLLRRPTDSRANTITNLICRLM